MARHIQPAKLNGLGAPDVLELLPTSSAEFSIGAPVQRNSTNSEQIEEFSGGATVTGLLGFALQGCASGDPDFGNHVQVARANRNTEFLAHVWDSGAATPAIATVSDDGTYEGNQYGLVEANDEWYVDEDDTTDVVVEVTRENADLNMVYFKVIDSAIGD